MKKTIIIKPTHELVEKTQRNTLRSNVIGVVGEKNSTILEFIKPSDINGDNIGNYTMRAVLNNKSGSYLVSITGTELVIGSDLTTDTELTLAVQFLKNDEVKWESFPLKFRLFPALDDSGESVLNELKKQWTAEAQRPLTILVNRVTEKVTELLSERRNKI